MRRESRELVFKVIYEGMFNNNPESFELISKEYQLDDSANLFVQELLKLWHVNKEKIREIIAGALVGYEYDRVFKVDIALISLAVLEINFYKLTPKNVVINEVIELSKKFSTEKSYSFINGILKKLV